MNLFDFKDGKVVITPEALLIGVFKDIYEGDKSKDKENALRDLSFIYLYSHFKSPYAIYTEDTKRRQEVCRSVYKDEKYKISKELVAACKEFEELHTTVSMRLLKSARGAAVSIQEYFETKRKTALDDDSATALIKNLGAIGKTIESINALEEKVKKEQLSSNKIRGRDSGVGALEDF